MCHMWGRVSRQRAHPMQRPCGGFLELLQEVFGAGRSGMDEYKTLKPSWTVTIREWHVGRGSKLATGCQSPCFCAFLGWISPYSQGFSNLKNHHSRVDRWQLENFHRAKYLPSCLSSLPCRNWSLESCLWCHPPWPHHWRDHHRAGRVCSQRAPGSPNRHSHCLLRAETLDGEVTSLALHTLPPST